MRLQDVKLYFRVRRAKRWQEEVLVRIRERAKSGGRVRVFFFVTENAKWKCQPIYERLAASEAFEPLVLIGLLPRELESIRNPADAEAIFSPKEAYFDRCGCLHRRVYEGFPLKLASPNRIGEGADLVFLQQPWGLPKPYKPYLLSRFALPMYVPYSVPLLYDPDLHGQPFHNSLHTIFLLNTHLISLYKANMRGRPSILRYEPSGHPALDSVAAAMCKYKVVTPRTVIYAPHFSFPHPKNVLGVSTFLENGRFILEFAKNHPGISWVFKPHPKLAESLVSTGGWSEDDVKDYYEEWRHVGRVVLDGNYHRLFAESFAMITDSVSFLAEYGATGHPIIRPLTGSQRAEGSLLECSPYIREYYQTRGNAELLKALESVVIRGEDPKRDSRLAAIKRAKLSDGCATDYICDYLQRLISPSSPA